MNIAEFLEARIAEDERKAEAGGYHNGSGVFANDNYGCLLVQPARVLAECAAKRVIIDVHHPHDHGGAHGDAVFCDECQWDRGDDSPRIDNQPVEGFGTHPCRTLKALAAVYKDHPDYQQDWSDAT